MPAPRHREILFIPVVGVVAVLLLLAAAALALPRSARAVRGHVVAARPEDVFDLLARPITWNALRQDGTPEFRRVPGTPLFGRGAAVERSTGLGADEVVRIVSFEAGRRVRFEREADGLPLFITGEYLLEPEGEGTRVTLTLELEARESIFARLPLALPERTIEPDLEATLDGLARYLEERS